ncbi:MAG: DUF3611 family protein [Phormidium sp. BM_Day4_Bin.17]|nr:DUF3611 family protein [Phormidium sp. BM_Day4_Bin.17]UCJ13401.1 MAG: DUF3611 family protein [Phormidium sp. PBR-2020]
MNDENQLPTRDTAIYEGQIPPSLERVIPAMQRFGQISFWFQLVLGVIAGLIFFFAGFVGSNTGEPNRLSPEEGPGLFFAIAGLVALAIGMYWALRYTQIAKRLAIPDPSLRPTRSQTLGSLQTGVVINLVGMLFSLVAAQIITGLLMVKVLSSEGVQFSPAALSRLVQPIDIFVVLANTNTLFAHFVALSCSLWLLRLIQTIKTS